MRTEADANSATHDSAGKLSIKVTTLAVESLDRRAGVTFGWGRCRVGISPTGKRCLFTAHVRSGRSTQRFKGYECPLRPRSTAIAGGGLDRPKLAECG